MVRHAFTIVNLVLPCFKLINSLFVVHPGLFSTHRDTGLFIAGAHDEDSDTDERGVDDMGEQRGIRWYWMVNWISTLHNFNNKVMIRTLTQLSTHYANFFTFKSMAKYIAKYIADMSTSRTSVIIEM